MLKRNIFGRGFDSPRLHQSSFATKWRTKTATAKLQKRSRAPNHRSVVIRSELRPGKPIFLIRNGVENEDCKPEKTRGMKGFHYVYILKSEKESARHYTGLTDDLESRLNAHNSGQVTHTAKYRPWKIEMAIAFRSKKKAASFEKYLKSHSGRAFASKHF